MAWEQKIVDPAMVMRKIRPGMSIFLGTGVSEPRTLIHYLMDASLPNLADLQLIQLLSFSDEISLKTLDAQKYRLKTFYTGQMVDKAITEGQVDLIPNRFLRLPRLFDSQRILVDAAFIQVTPPDASGYCSLGVSLDVARIAMEKATLVVGEINPKIPRTFGDTFVNVSEFDYLVYADQDPIYFDRWETPPPFDQIAARMASLIPDKSCIAFSIGPLFEALLKKLKGKQHLGIHSPIFTDALMDLVKSGAVTNRYKEIFRGKSIASYGIGTPELMDWLDRNPMVEFQGIDRVFDPINIGINPGVIAVIPARTVDLSGSMTFQEGLGNVISGPMELVDFFMGAEISKGGITIIGLPSRNPSNVPNIQAAIETNHNRFGFEESIDMVVTEFGIARLNGLSVRERAQALIEIAHPDDRKGLVEQAKTKRILYPDQIFLSESPHLYPDEIQEEATLKNNLRVRFRGIRPSDEEQMRRLFYRFSDDAIYYRYFASIKTMPHAKMQEYVNIDWNHTMSIVGLIGEPGQGQIIAEGRYLMETFGPRAETAFVVDEGFNNKGIATYLLKLLMKLGKTRGVEFFTADVLFSNIGMMKVFKKMAPKVEAVLQEGAYNISFPIT